MRHCFLIPSYEGLEITEVFMANQIYLPRTSLLALHMNPKPKIGKH
jgi:hypothetical protein